MKSFVLPLILLLVFIGALVVAQDPTPEASALAKEVDGLKSSLSQAEARVESLEREAKKHNDEMSKMNAYAETMRGKLAAATTKIDKLTKEKSEVDATGEAHSKCSIDLKAEQEAKTKTEQKLKKATEKVKELEETVMRKNTELESTRVGLKAAADSTKQADKKASDKIQGLENTVLKLTEKLEQGNTCTGCIKSVTSSAEAYIQSVASHPSVEQALAVSKEYIALGSAKASQVYADAQPFIAEATETLTVYMKFLMEKGQELRLIITKKASSILKTTDEFMQSQAVSSIVGQVNRVTSEIKSLIKSLMLQNPSLAPFVSQGFIDAFVYAILGFPVLTLLSCCSLCKRKKRRKEEEKPAPTAGKGKKTRNASNRR